MKYELTRIDQLIDVSIHPENLVGVTDEEFEQKKVEWLQVVRAEKDRICLKLAKGMLASKNHKQAQVYVQHHQRSVNTLISTISNYLKNKSYKRKLPCYKSFYTFCMEITAVLESILQYIMTHFTSYFDPYQPPPRNYSSTTLSDLKSKLHLIRERLSEAEANQALVDIVLKPAEAFMTDAEVMVTYHLLSYYRELANEILKLDEGESMKHMFYNYQFMEGQLQDMGMKELPVNIQLNVLLLHMNYNSHEYVNFAIVSLLRKLEDKTDAQRLHILKVYRRLMCQVRLKPGMVFIPEIKESPAEQIRHWLDQEIEFFLQMQAVGIVGGNDPNVKDTQPGVAAPIDALGAKIPLNLSIPELGVIARTSQEAGLMFPMPPAQLCHTLASAYQTIGSEQLSFHNLKNHYYTLKKSAVTSFIRKLQDWIKVLRRYE